MIEKIANETASLKQEAILMPTLITGILVYYLLTPATLIWGIHSLIKKFRQRRENILQEQKYAVYLLLLIELITALAGVILQVTIQNDSLTVDSCQNIHTVLIGVYNLHVFLAAFYLYHMKKRIEDPTVRNFSKEITILVSLLLTNFIFSIGSKDFQCTYMTSKEGYGVLTGSESIDLKGGKLA